LLGLHPHRDYQKAIDEVSPELGDHKRDWIRRISDMSESPGGSQGVPTLSESVLLKLLELEWNDHIQTRSQTWRTIEIEALIAVGVVGADIQFRSVLVTAILGAILIVATLVGVGITFHHRNTVEVQKFTHIIELERRLGAIPDVFPSVSTPARVRLADAFNLRKNNTSLFILRMHVFIGVFGVVYVAARVVAG